jgi:hypothetical protein
VELLHDAKPHALEPAHDHVIAHLVVHLRIPLHLSVHRQSSSLLGHEISVISSFVLRDASSIYRMNSISW